VRSTDFTSYRLAIGNKPSLLPIALKEKDLSIAAFEISNV